MTPRRQPLPSVELKAGLTWNTQAYADKVLETNTVLLSGGIAGIVPSFPDLGQEIQPARQASRI
jgi:hypothetical protein